MPDYKDLPVGEMVKNDAGHWLYRDSYNQVWAIRPNEDHNLPLRVELRIKLTPDINPLESVLRRRL